MDARFSRFWRFLHLIASFSERMSQTPTTLFSSLKKIYYYFGPCVGTSCPGPELDGVAPTARAVMVKVNIVTPHLPTSMLKNWRGREKGHDPRARAPQICPASGRLWRITSEDFFGSWKAKKPSSGKLSQALATVSGVAASDAGHLFGRPR